MSEVSAKKARIHWFARLERRLHAWRERRARRRGRTATVLPFAGYGGTGWVRVVGRVLIVPPHRRSADGEYESIRGWRSFVGIPVGFAHATITLNGRTYDVIADRGGVIDAVIDADLPSGWQTFTMSVENQKPVEATAFIVGDEVDFGVVSDVDDTVMVTALPRPFIAAWNSFVVDEHARIPVPGMAVLIEQLMRQHPGTPMIYLSTGAWNVAPTLSRFMSRHLFPRGSMLLTDWGPTHDRWFRSGREHKLRNLRRLAEEFPNVKWLLIGDDGQHDEAIYTEFMIEHPDSVAGVAIRQLSATEAMLAGGRAVSDDHAEHTAPWVAASDGAGLREKLTDVGILH
ncbi:App1 family protein [Microbacterium sp.]|uniref:App1 family protein n=1 Tax=Microbacterium sp. TaxID=51671 RepID=UPI003F9CF5A1